MNIGYDDKRNNHLSDENFIRRINYVSLVFLREILSCPTFFNKIF